MDFVIENGVLKKYKGAGDAVVIPDSVTEIGSSAFFRCYSLTSVTIPDSVTTIGEKAFRCSSLTSVTIPDSVTTIGEDAFKNCSSLTSVTIGDSVTTIGERAFEDCSSLTSVTIGDSVTTIGESAFSDCSSLTTVVIPDSVTEIGSSAFSGCSSLTSIEVSENNTHYMSESGVLFNKAQKKLIRYPAENGRTEYIITDSVTEIGWHAFENCSSLTSVTIPDSVTTIGYEAFSGCESLTSVIIRKIVLPKEMIEAFQNYHGVSFSYVLTMIVDYSVKMSHEVKYDAVWKIFSNCPDDERTAAYVKKNFSKMFTFLLDRDDAETVQKVLDSGKFLTKRNIDKHIQYAQEKKRVEILTMLINHKGEKIGYSDPIKKLKL